MKALLGFVILILILSSVYKNKQNKSGMSSAGDQSDTPITEIAENVRKAIGLSIPIDTFSGNAEVMISDVYPFEGAIMVTYKIYEGDLEVGKSLLKAAEREIRARARGHQGKYMVRTRCIEFNGEQL